MRASAFVMALAFGAVSPTMVPTASQAAWFMKIASIQGESKDPTHQGWIDLQSFSWRTAPIGGPLAQASAMAVANGTTVVSCSRSASNGTAVAVKRVDASSPRLSQALTRGTPLGSVEVQETDASGALLLDANLVKALVSGNAVTVGGDAPQETITFVYGTLKIDYHNQDCGGSNERSTKNETLPHPATAPTPGGPH
jgi:type VI protein secretion system component Hcp